MKKRIIVSLVALLTMTGNAFAINVTSGQEAAWWGWVAGTPASGTYGDFILAGGLGKSGPHGTFGDEWGLVGLVANKIVEHGGYFCPYQIQCANKYKKKRSWTEYYRPTGFSTDKCAWLCESGYSGTNCMPVDNVPSSCEVKPQNKTSGGKYAGLSMKMGGEREGMVEGEIIGFAQWGNDPECDVVLGITKYMEHGVFAAPIQVCCGRDNWKRNDSFVSSLGIAGTEKILCASGYKPNSAGSDCEPINADLCLTQNMTFCANFEKSKYTSASHTLEESSSCVKYFCSEPGKAFPSLGNAECVECANGVKGGPNPNTGVCVSCNSGEYFNKTAGKCESAAAYTKMDLQYGKGKTRNTNTDVDNQCWTVTTPDEYKVCVKNGGVSSR